MKYKRPGRSGNTKADINFLYDFLFEFLQQLEYNEEVVNKALKELKKEQEVKNAY